MKTTNIIWQNKKYTSVTDFTIKRIVPGNLKKVSFHFHMQKYVILALHRPRKYDDEFFLKVF